MMLDSMRRPLIGNRRLYGSMLLCPATTMTTLTLTLTLPAACAAVGQ